MTRLFPAACLHLVMLASTRRPTGRRLSTLLSSDYPQQIQFTLESKQDCPVTLWVRGKELDPSLMFYYLSKSITFNPQVSSKLKLRRSGSGGHSGAGVSSGQCCFDQEKQINRKISSQNAREADRELPKQRSLVARPL